jgi:hypothetical protein
VLFIPQPQALIDYQDEWDRHVTPTDGIAYFARERLNVMS